MQVFLKIYKYDKHCWPDSDMTIRADMKTANKTFAYYLQRWVILIRRVATKFTTGSSGDID